LGVYDTITLLDVPWPDLNGDRKVNLLDLAIFVSQWLDPVCNEANNWCIGADFDKSSRVNFVDYAVLTGKWLMIKPMDPDLNRDGIVNLKDLLLFVSQWPRSDCELANNWCVYCDFNQDGKVDLIDFSNIANYWLEKM